MEEIHFPGPKQVYKVLVSCFTYNQSKYITDSLNGFAMQKTNFPFVCLVMDDCSTDGEQDVIKAWMEHECDMDRAEYFEIDFSNIILVPHKTNVNCTFVFYLLKQNLYGTGKKIPLITPWREHSDYEALCEGDDYWTTPTKLQKQVDYLDAHPEVVYSCHRFKVLVDSTGEMEDDWIKFFKQDGNAGITEFTFDTEYTFTTDWVTQTLTQVVRTDVINADFAKQFKWGRDVHQIYNILQSGKGVCHSFVGAVYRINNGGIFGSKSKKEKNRVKYLMFKELYEKTSDGMFLTLYRASFHAYWEAAGRPIIVNSKEFFDYIHLLVFLLIKKLHLIK